MSHEEHFSIDVPEVLPHERVYSIQIGYKMFKLSGASLSSDSPSYFTEYFSRKDAERHARCVAAESESKTGTISLSSEEADINVGNKYLSAYEEKDVLFIDRSPEVFELIYNHLQGYSITIKDENQYTMLFADAMYYNLPRLRYFLKHSDYYYACIGGKSFKIPKNLLTANGNSMNYFEITIAALYADLEYIYMKKKPIRPPPQSPPYVPRSPELFDDLLALLNGAELTLDDRKRNSLIKECRFYHLLNLEQTLLKCEIKYDPYYKLEVIVMYLKDLTSKGVTLRRKTEDREDTIESQLPTSATTACATQQSMADIFPECKKQKVENWRIFTYSRPYLDETPRDLIFQVNTMDCLLYFNKRQKVIHVNLRSETAQRFTSVFNAPLRDLNIYLDDYRDPQRVEGLIIPCCIFVTDLTVNGIRCTNICSLIDENTIAEKIPDFTTASGSHSCVPGLKLVLLKSMWRFAIKNEELVLVCIRADATTCINEFHHSIGFL